MSKKALISARENIFVAQAMIWTVAVAARADEVAAGPSIYYRLHDNPTTACKAWAGEEC
jgi:hypothetical protein